MRTIAGFAEPDEGDIRLDGQSILGIAANRRPVNMIFQHLALFPMMSVADNIAYGLKRRGVARGNRDVRVKRILERIGLPDAGGKRIDQLSGGQKQRVAIARCLVLEPSLLLLDEPLGALDLKLREQMKIELKQLQATFGTTFVYITHDQSEALVMSDRVAVMNNGRFEQVGRPQDLYYQPSTPFVAGFVGQSNRLAGTLAGPSAVRLDGGLTIAVADRHQADDGGVCLFLRPESVVLDRRSEALDGLDNRHPATVEDMMFDGAASTALVRLGQGGPRLRVALPQTGQLADLSRSEAVWVGWKAESVVTFAAAGS
jgi:spermidine/putrescine transport system ATP-binding protein